MKLIYLTATISVCSVFPHSAFAYLDPGTGSLLIQMLIAGVMGTLFTVKLYWYKIKSYISSLFGRDNVDASQNNTTDIDESSSEDR